MMELKFNSRSNIAHTKQALNRTMMELKYFIGEGNIIYNIALNRTMMELKSAGLTEIIKGLCPLIVP